MATEKNYRRSLNTNISLPWIKFDELSKLFSSKVLESICDTEMGQSPPGTSYNEFERKSLC